MALLDDNTQPQTPMVNTDQTKKPQTGTGFTNLNKFIGANQDNKLGSTVQTGVGNSANAVKAGVSNVQNSFVQNVNDNRLDSDANKAEVSNVLNNVGNVTDQQLNDFTKFRQGQYNGPTDLGDVSNLKTQAQQTENLVNQGQDALLSRYVGGNQYTAGQKRLDNILLGQTGGDALKNARQSANGLTQGVVNAENLASQQGQNAADAAKQFANDVTTQTTGAYDTMNSGLNGRIQQFNDAETNRNAQYDQLQKLLGAGTVGSTVGMADATGVTTKSQAAYNAIDQAIKSNLLSEADANKLAMLIPAASYMGQDPTKLISNQLQNISNSNITRGSLATGDERRGLDNLQRLLGNQTEFYSTTDAARDNGTTGTAVDNAARTYDLSALPQATLGTLNLNAEGVNRYLANTASSMAGKTMPYANNQVNPTITGTNVGPDLDGQKAALAAVNNYQGADPSTMAGYQANLGALKTLANYAGQAGGRFTDVGGRTGLYGDQHTDNTGIVVGHRSDTAGQILNDQDELLKLNQVYGSPFDSNPSRGQMQNFAWMRNADGSRAQDYVGNGSGVARTIDQGTKGNSMALGNIDQSIIDNLPQISNMWRPVGTA